MSAQLDAAVGDPYYRGGTENFSGNYASGAFQSLAGLGMGYLTRRLDIDLSNRAATTGTTSIKSDQRPIDNTPAGQLKGMLASPVAMLAIGGAAVLVAYLLLKG